MTDSKGELLGPGASKRRLRQQLRRLREAAELTQEQAAHALEWHLSKILRIEAGTSGVAVTDLHAILRLYRADDPETIDTMTAWARRAKEPAWWSAYRTFVPRGFLYYIGLENEAVSMHYFQDAMLPGLLQCEGYARAVLAGTGFLHEDSEEFDRRLSLRLRRQEELFLKPQPPQVTVVLDEAVLHRFVGSAAIMKTQLEHLLALLARPYLRVHVIPFTCTYRPFVGSTFTILEFGEPDDAVVYVESGSPRRGEDTMEHGQDIAAYREMFRAILASAASVERSQQIIKEIADRL